MTDSSRPSGPSHGGLPFSIRTVAARDGAIRIVVTGELDIATAPRLNAGLLRELLAGLDVELDLSRVGFMDACALGTIMGARARFERREQTFLVLLEPSSQPHRLLTLTGILAMLTVRDDAATAPCNRD
jgi:anti-anti-sigma factor